MPLTHYPWCEFINMGYYIHAVARTHSFYDDIVVKLPIIIEPMVGAGVAAISKNVSLALNNFYLLYYKTLGHFNFLTLFLRIERS